MARYHHSVSPNSQQHSGEEDSYNTMNIGSCLIINQTISSYRSDLFTPAGRGISPKSQDRVFHITGQCHLTLLGDVGA